VAKIGSLNHTAKNRDLSFTIKELRMASLIKEKILHMPSQRLSYFHPSLLCYDKSR
jgi:hypothetical protein